MKKEKTDFTFTPEELEVSRWDTSQHLDSEEEIRGFLEACLEENCSPRAFLRAVGECAKARGMTEIARKAGITRESLYKSFNGTCRPEFETVWKVARAMGVGFAMRTASEPMPKADAKAAKAAKRDAAAPPVKRLPKNGNGNGKRARKTA